MKKALVLALIVAGITAAAASAVTKGSSPTVAASRLAACTSGQIGFMGPLTGPVAFLGHEQGTWAKYAIDSFNAANGTQPGLLPGGTSTYGQINGSRAGRTIALSARISF